MIIAVDGPTASGKGTISKKLAAHFGLPHLDTGLLYRAVGRQVILNGGDPDNLSDALAAVAFPDALLDDPVLRNEATGSLASRIAWAENGIRWRSLPATANNRLERSSSRRICDQHDGTGDQGTR